MSILITECDGCGRRIDLTDDSETLMKRGDESVGWCCI